ncbi:MAG TPA: YetF domain-containing protein, partial [Pyrinomonadaceae bacterium]|nr:YetF domain-containing protein [Pyrinomonadaceae bacterium]
GNAPFFPTLGAGFVLVVLHWLLAVLSFYSDGFGAAVKGHERTLIRAGEIQWDNMRQSHLSEKDLLEALRLNAKVTDPCEVEVAHFERNGEISAIPRRRDPRIVEVAVEAGVQTVRIELE